MSFDLSKRIDRTLPTLDVFFTPYPGTTDIFQHAVEKEGSTFRLKIKYIRPNQVDRIISNTQSRQMLAGKGRKKAMVADPNAAAVALCQDIILDWEISIGALKLLKVVANFDGTKDDELMPFTPANLRALASNSDIGSLVTRCLGDYEFWFPDDEEEEGNSPTGPTGSTGESRVGPASTNT